MVEVSFGSFEWLGEAPPRQHAMKFTFNVKTDQRLLLWFYSGILKFKLSESWQYIAASGKKFFGDHFQREQNFTLPFQFNDRTLDHIEDKRDGAGRIEFKVDVELVGFEAGRLSGFNIDNLRDLGKLERFNDTVDGKLYRSQWVELLEQWGYREYTVIEIPTHSEVPEDFSNPLQKLNEAREDYRNGNWSGVLANCDDVFNRLNQMLEGDLYETLDELILGEKLADLNELIKKIASKNEETIKPDDFRGLCEKYKHEVGNKIAMKRDAELFLHITSAFLKYFGMRLEEG